LTMPRALRAIWEWLYCRLSSTAARLLLGSYHHRCPEKWREN
jgi:hypothetical protein